jgi:hypothetical protein
MAEYHIDRSWVKVSKSDMSLFLYNKGNDIILVLIYVHDIIVTGNSPEAIAWLLEN